MSSVSSSSHGNSDGSIGSQDLGKDENVDQEKDLSLDGEGDLFANALNGLEEILGGKESMTEKDSMFKDWYVGRSREELTRTVEGDVIYLASLGRFRGKKYHGVWVETIRRV